MRQNYIDPANMLPACSQSLIGVLNEQAARSTCLTEKLVNISCENCFGSKEKEVDISFVTVYLNL